MTVEAIVAAVVRQPARHVVLTGGEPMVAPEIHALAAALHELGRHITIETAATVAPGGTRALAFPVCFTIAGKHVLTVRATLGAASDELRQRLSA
jgi:organic radical activating enzyme